MSQSGVSLHDAIARDILAHLAANPQAADSAEGITQWWLTPPINLCDPTEVLTVLTTLVAQGRVARVTLPEGQVLYRSVDPDHPPAHP